MTAPLGASTPGPARVWAPRATAVSLRVVRSGREITVPLAAEADGWFVGGEVLPGDDYGFLVDAAGPFPDPRSPAQPHGVHGLSRMETVDAFPWRDEGWTGIDARGAVLYEAHVGTLTPEGTLDSAIADLPRLARLGIQMVSLMPVAPFPGRRGWGYDGVGLYAVHEAYGGPLALARFVDAAHAHGIGVCLDVVYNHQGPDGNYLGVYGPFFTPKHQTPWGHGLNVDGEGSAQVRAHVIGSALRWLRDFHVDALRLDAIHEIHDDSPRHVLAELSDEVAALSRELGRPLSLIAESDLNDERVVTETAHGGLGQTLQWADDVHHALHAYFTGERQGYYVDFGPVEVLDHVYRHVFWHDGRLSPFRGREWGRPVSPTTDRTRFVAYAATHDQVGNRALGDRPSTRLSPGAQAASLAFVLLSPFTPMLFMGEEHGETAPFQFFTDHEPTLGAAVTAGRRTEFGRHGWPEDDLGSIPDPQDPQTFLRSRLAHRDDEAEPHASLRHWTRTCIDLRRVTRLDGAWDAWPPGVRELAPRVVVMDGPVQVIANLSAHRVTAAVNAQDEVLAHWGIMSRLDAELMLEPDAVVLVRRVS